MTHNCILRKFEKPELCSSMNPIYVGLHGHSGKGGRVGNANAPEEYRYGLLHDSPVAESQPDIYEVLDRYVKSFDKMFDDNKEGLEGTARQVKSLYLYSRAAGTGKTTTSVALMNEYMIRNYLGHIARGKSAPRRPVYFLDVNKWQTLYNAFNRPRVPEDKAEKAATEYYEMMDFAMDTEFVVLDDIGVRDSTEGFRGDLHTIINERVANQRPTIYTSNITINELDDVFGEERLSDRVRDLTQIIEFKGKSKRGRRT